LASGKHLSKGQEQKKEDGKKIPQSITLVLFKHEIVASGMKGLELAADVLVERRSVVQSIGNPRERLRL